MTWPPLLLIFALFTLNPVTISVYPRWQHAPATFRITVLVPRHATNRRICYGADGPERKGSCIDLAGDDARRVWTVFWEFRTPGQYQASAILTRMDEGRAKTYVQVQPFTVLGLGVEP